MLTDRHGDVVEVEVMTLAGTVPRPRPSDDGGLQRLPGAKVLWSLSEGAGNALSRPKMIFANQSSRLNYVPFRTQRRCADGPEADLKLRMLDARFSPA
jgi:hypothetical protein